MRGLWFCGIVCAIVLGGLQPAEGRPPSPVPPPESTAAARAMNGFRGSALLASMKNTRNYISYEADSTPNTTPSRGVRKRREVPPIQDKKGYIEYQCGPSPAQSYQEWQQQQEDRENSWRMLQNLFLNLPAPSDAEAGVPPRVAPSGK